jgi:hypothetical protein
LTGRQRIALAKKQRELMAQFYAKPYTKVIFDKETRKALEKSFADTRVIPDINLSVLCPAVLAEFEKAVQNNKLLQQAVFSECVYAQTLANMFGRSDYFNFNIHPDCLSSTVLDLIASYHLTPRHVYRSRDGRRALVQAGGNAGTDSALITIEDNDVFTIEFKEPLAKTSEPDIPKAYGEDGRLSPPDSFLMKYPQFEYMLNEQTELELNFWDVRGTNVNTFSIESIQYAVSQNYAAKKYADVICVEDSSGYLTMMPSNQVQNWSETVGEIRPVGRNTLKVWTPKFLAADLKNMGATISEGIVQLPLNQVTVANARGSNGNTPSRFKFGKIFLVRIEDARKTDSHIFFKLSKVLQVKPTISAHMDFSMLRVEDVKNHYRADF